MRTTILSAIVLFAALEAAAQSAVQSAAEPIGGGVVPGSFTHDCLEPETTARFWNEVAAERSERSTLHGAPSPVFGWPLERRLGDGLVLVNYVDDDGSRMIRDYMGGMHTFDGHGGTDVTLLNFAAMDRGMRVLSVSDGVVLQTQWGQPDRIADGPPIPAKVNHVIVENSDGSYSWYLNLRRGSVTVESGETVRRGQVLGLVGSAGHALGPHLHFETGAYDGGTWRSRDPWSGLYNTSATLWEIQEPYVDTLPIRIYDMGVFTRAAAGPDIDRIPVRAFAERLPQPAIFGSSERLLGFWLQLQGNEAETYTVEIRRPDNSLFGSRTHTLSAKTAYGWHYWYWRFMEWEPQPEGIWRADLLVDGEIVRSVEIPVGETTTYAPRFAPLGGRSIRINGEPRLDTLRVADGAAVTFSLVGAPPSVRLERDSIVTIAGASPQPTRSLYFQAVARDAAGRGDTMWYHLVDPTKPLDQVVAIAEKEEEKIAAGSSIALPNPFAGRTTIRFSLDEPGRVSLTLHTMLGERIATLIDAEAEQGEQSIEWSGVGLPAGAYIYRLHAPGIDESRILLRR